MAADVNSEIGFAALIAGPNAKSRKMPPMKSSGDGLRLRVVCTFCGWFLSSRRGGRDPPWRRVIVFAAAAGRGRCARHVWC